MEYSDSSQEIQVENRHSDSKRMFLKNIRSSEKANSAGSVVVVAAAAGAVASPA
jgi:NADPH-dependent curcumin reductase CurA